jgi:hypothetical protein
MAVLAAAQELRMAKQAAAVPVDIVAMEELAAASTPVVMAVLDQAVVVAVGVLRHTALAAVV